MRCVNCGAQLKDGARFCESCGAKVVNTTPSKKNNSQPKKSKKGSRGILLILLVAAIGAGIYMFSNLFGGGGGGDNPDGGNPPQPVVKDTLVAETGDEPYDDDDWSSIFNLTDEDMEYLKNNPIEVTPENSPCNPAFIDVTFTDDDYAQGFAYFETVSKDMPEADFPELGIHVNLDSWNLDNEEDTLVIAKLPDKIDENTGLFLHAYYYCLLSGQSKFQTEVEVTGPVLGDPDMFYGFVSHNEETGKWEEMYCELSEDGKTYTAYLSHFSEQSALEKIKTEGIAAIKRFQQDGKSIFVQSSKEMQQKYEGSSHYLYPVEVSSTTDFEKFFSQQAKKEVNFAEKIMVESGKIPEKDALSFALECFGLNMNLDWVGPADDVAANTIGVVDFMKIVRNTMGKAVTSPLAHFGERLGALGLVLFTLDMSDQYAQGKAKEKIMEEKGLSIAGAVVTSIGLVAAVVSASTVSTVCAVVGAVICLGSTKTYLDEKIKEKDYPMGLPHSIQEATIHYYMQHNATSKNGYAKEQGWWDWLIGTESKDEKIESVLTQPEKLLDCGGRNWANAFDCLIKKYGNDPRRLNAECDALYSRFASAFWNEPDEVKKQYFLGACKKYINVNMYNHTGARVLRLSDCATMEGEDLSKYKFDPKAKQEWEALQLSLSLFASNLKATSPLLTMDEVKERLYGGGVEDPNYEVMIHKANKKLYHDSLVKQLRHCLAPVAHKYYEKKRHEGIMEVKKYLDTVVVPLLNTRVTFYARNLENPNGPYSSITNTDGTLPLFEFNSTKVPRFLPGNSEEVGTAFNLNLRANDKNAVLLETTVYHYLMFDCPTSVNIKYYDQGGKNYKTIDGKANWDNVKFVQEEKQEWSVWDIIGLPKVNIEDTKVPVEYGAKKGKKVQFVSFMLGHENLHDLADYDISDAVTAAFNSGSGSISNDHFSFTAVYNEPVKEYKDQSELIAPGSYESRSGSISVSVNISGTFDPKTGEGTCTYSVSESKNVTYESVNTLINIPGLKGKSMSKKNVTTTQHGDGSMTIKDDNTVILDIRGTSECKEETIADGQEPQTTNNKGSKRWQILFKVEK